MLPDWIVRLMERRDLEAAKDPMRPPAKAPVLHLLIGVDHVEAVQYARMHGYPADGYAHVASQCDLQGYLPPGEIRIHYMRDWAKVPEDVIARARSLKFWRDADSTRT
jgi:hypothetical protein